METFSYIPTLYDLYMTLWVLFERKKYIQNWKNYIQVNLQFLPMEKWLLFSLFIGVIFGHVSVKNIIQSRTNLQQGEITQ